MGAGRHHREIRARQGHPAPAREEPVEFQTQALSFTESALCPGGGTPIQDVWLYSDRAKSKLFLLHHPQIDHLHLIYYILL